MENCRFCHVAAASDVQEQPLDAADCGFAKHPLLPYEPKIHGVHAFFSKRSLLHCT